MIYNKSNVDEAIKILSTTEHKLWSVDIETYNPLEDAWFLELSAKQRPLNRMDSLITSVQVTLPNGEDFFFDFGQKQEGEDLRIPYGRLGDILSHCDTMVGHNLAFEYGMFLRHNFKFKGDLHDTMVMGVLYNENMPQGLKPSVKQRFGHEMPTYKETVGEGTMADLTAEQCYDYGMSDTVWTLKLYEWYKERIDMDYYEFFEMDMIKIVAEHYDQGQKLDLEELKRIMHEDIAAKDKILAEYPKLAELNLNSPKQIGNWLFNEMGLAPFKVSKKTGAPSTDKESLYQLIVKYGKDYPVIAAFGEIRKIETRLKLYYRPYPHLIYPDGLLHSEIRQTGTVTGRFSMNSPNLQQIAKRGEGVKVRGAFVPFAEKGHDCIVSIDWSQIELRMAAHMSQDPKLLDAYRTGKDLHTVSGTNISGDTYEDMVEKLLVEDKEAKTARQKGKTMNFAALYLAGAKRLAAFDLLDCSVAEAEDFLAAHKVGYAGYFYDYVNEVNTFAREHLYVKSLFGRVRRLPNLNSPIKALKHEAEGQALNFTIQGSCAELMKAAINTMYANNLLFEDDFTFIAPVHDEVVFSAKRSEVHKWLPKVKEIMERVPQDFSVPLDAEAAIGPNFAEQWDVGSDLSQEAIDRVWEVHHE
jgi:DNA polymerase-1